MIDAQKFHVKLNQHGAFSYSILIYFNENLKREDVLLILKSTSDLHQFKL